MKKQYEIGETIAVGTGHERVPAGNYIVTGIGNDVSGNKPSEYTKIYQCTETKSRISFHINEADLEEQDDHTSKMPEPTSETPIIEEKADEKPQDDHISEEEEK